MPKLWEEIMEEDRKKMIELAREDSIRRELDEWEKEVERDRKLAKIYRRDEKMSSIIAEDARKKGRYL